MGASEFLGHLQISSHNSTRWIISQVRQYSCQSRFTRIVEQVDRVTWSFWSCATGSWSTQTGRVSFGENRLSSSFGEESLGRGPWRSFLLQ